MADPGLLRQAKAMRLDVSPLDGQKLQQLVDKIYASSPEVLRETRKALGFDQ